MSLEKASIQTVIEFEQRVRNRDARDVSKDKTGKHNGYDVLSTDHAGQEETIEVKFTRTKTLEIPDAYETEFTEPDHRWVADWLYVVVFHNDKVARILPFSKEEVDKHRKGHRTYHRMRFAPSLQTEFRNRFKEGN